MMHCGVQASGQQESGSSESLADYFGALEVRFRFGKHSTCRLYQMRRLSLHHEPISLAMRHALNPFAA